MDYGEPFFGNCLIGYWWHPEMEPVLYPNEVKGMAAAGEVVWTGRGWYYKKYQMTLEYDEAA